MQKTKGVIFSIVLLIAASMMGCQGDDSDDEIGDDYGSKYDVLEQTPVLPADPYNYANIALPNYLNSPPMVDQDNTPADNEVTDAGATLGRVLFYDQNMSANNLIACASCHVQENAFTDPKVFSEGFEGGLTGRNSMSLFFAKYYANAAFFWDERAATLEDQVLMPIQDHIEMGMTLTDLVEKLDQVEYYDELFEDAFGDDEITTSRISKSLAQFIRSMVSAESKYDVGLAQVAGGGPGTVLQDFPNFTETENLGKALYFGKATCAGCHGTQAFSMPRALNNGLDADLADNGVGDATGNTADNGRFKAPSIRNVALTAPYMHDGRFATLEEVVEHYNTGVKAHPNLSPPLVSPDGQPIRLNLTEDEKDALVAFMKTLTDVSFTQDVKFSSPF